MSFERGWSSLQGIDLRCVLAWHLTPVRTETFGHGKYCFSRRYKGRGTVHETDMHIEILVNNTRAKQSNHSEAKKKESQKTLVVIECLEKTCSNS